MLSKFDFTDLFVLDLANNHQGSLEHGLNVISKHSEIVKKHKVKAGIKFQFRNIPDFIHIDEIENPLNKHVPRFLSTKLDWDDTLNC